MGANKALLPFAGQRIIDGLIGKLRALFPEVLVVTNDPAPYRDLEVPTIPDRVPGKGPVGGIYTALHWSSFSHTFCIACDMPLANPALITYLCEQSAGYDAVVPRTGDGYQPLHAVYGKGCLPHLEAMLRAGQLKVDALFSAVRLRIVEAQEIRRLDPDLTSFLNVNTPEEMEAALRFVAGKKSAEGQGSRGAGEQAEGETGGRGEGERAGPGRHA